MLGFSQLPQNRHNKKGQPLAVLSYCGEWAFNLLALHLS
jgi:hypothetical protein